MEASDTDIEFENGEFKVAGTDKKVPFAQVALTAYVPHNYPLDKLEPGLNENAFYDPTNFTYPAGTYICEVEVDPATGVVRGGPLHRGRRLRQHHQPDDRRRPGARRHGPGHRPGAAGKRVYDKNGQLLTGSYMDYAMPRADDLPSSRSTPKARPAPTTRWA
jgi:carbon-monoxide dehydrogenase large subunit